MEMLMDDKISVIVPTYNNAPWLPKCLESIRNQTYSNLEILVIDDGSQDETWEILQTFSQNDPRIIPVHQENGGVTTARLCGVSRATGDWIGFVDGDDWIEPDMYEHLLRNAKTYDADISHCGYQLVYPDGRRKPYYGTGELRKQTHLQGLQDLLEEKLVEPGLWTKLFKRELLGKLDSCMDRDIKNNEDMLMNYYIFREAQCSVFEDICLYCYRVRDNSASRKPLDVYSIYNPIEVREKILRMCPEELKDTGEMALANTCLYVYAKLSLEAGTEYAEHAQKVRSIIAAFPFVVKGRNRILVWLVRFFPGLFRWIYRLYWHLFRSKFG